MKILAIIIGNQTEKQPYQILEDVKIDSLFVKIDDKLDEASMLNKVIKDIDSSYTHIVVLPEKFTLYKTYSSLVEEYYTDDKAVYLPLINLQDGDGNFKGIINSSIWWPSLTVEPGVLDSQSAYSQVDTTLYGGIIPVSIIKKYKFKKDLNIYYHFEFLNNILSKKVKVVGIPKILTTIVFDYTLESIPKEKKIEMFEAAREDYKPSEG